MWSLYASNHTWHGAALAWHTDLSPLVSQIPVTYDRINAISIAFSSKCRILAISLYAPTAGKDDEFLECIDFLTEFISNNIKAHPTVIIGTDSNCSSKSSKRRLLAWSRLCDQFSLSISSTETPTFHHHNGSSESCIDYFVSNITIEKSGMVGFGQWPN